MAVDGDDAVGVLVDDDAVRVHAEGADEVFKLLGTVDDLTLVQLVGQVGEHVRGQFHAHADIDAVGVGGDVHALADGLHPLAAAAADGDDAVFAGVGIPSGLDLVAVAGLLHAGDGGVEVKIDLVLQLVENVAEDDVVYVGAEMADLRVEQVQAVFKAGALDLGVGGGVELGALAAVGEVYLVHILHQVDGFLLADILEQRAAELVRDVVLTIGERARAAEAAHDRAGGTLDAGFDLLAVDRASALVKRLAQLKYADLQCSVCLRQFVGGKYSSGACAHDDNVIVHGASLQSDKKIAAAYAMLPKTGNQQQ